MHFSSVICVTSLRLTDKICFNAIKFSYGISARSYYFISIELNSSAKCVNYRRTCGFIKLSEWKFCNCLVTRSSLYVVKGNYQILW